MKLKNNNNILCSVSSGYSSVYMALMIKEWYPDHNIIYLMANTSKERSESLDFMNKCVKHYGIELNWIEAVINNNKGKGTGFKVVDFENLKVNGEIFETAVKKYGIPSVINKWCTRELKNVPMKKFADTIFGLNNYSIAVGIRADEIDRVSSSYKENNIFYPLVKRQFTTKIRNRFWNKQPIQISIPAYKGNCDLCFEKSNRKLMTIINEDPGTITWWKNIENKYSCVFIDGKENYNRYVESGGMFPFRNNLSVTDLVKMAENPFSKASDEYVYENDLFDLEGDCGGGCVVFF